MSSCAFAALILPAEVPMFVLLSACLNAPPPVQATTPPATSNIPEAAPAPGSSLSKPVAEVVAAVPDALSARYVITLSGDRRTLTVDPPPRLGATPARRDAASGVQVGDSDAGGKTISLSSGPFRNAEWVEGTLAERLTDAQRAAAPGWDPAARRWMLRVDGDAEAFVTTFAFAVGAEPAGVLSVCHEVTPILLAAPTRPIIVRKPVIYLDPEQPTRVRANVVLDRGDFTVRWPRPGDDGWDVVAFPGGKLVDGEGRSHRYLFWEAKREPFALDPRRAHLVEAGEGARYLERVCAAAAMRDEECDDLVTYWLPELEAHPYTLVEWLQGPYEQYAKLEVDPAPDTVIRVFLLLRPVDHPVEVGAPPLPRHVREGFTLVEWGGAVLD